MFNDKFSPELKNYIEAGEIFSAAFCNMDCTYCYIPKTDELRDIHNKIIEALENDEYIEILKKMYGGGEILKCLSFWGTEPTLTLSKITDKIETLYKEFKNLNRFDFSTNLLSHYKEIIRFTDELEKQDRKSELSFQVSIDGPPEITDKNRHKNSTKKILSNLEDLIKTLKEREYKNVDIAINFKSTLSMENINAMVDDFSKIEEYFDFFEELYKTILPYEREGLSIRTGTSPTHVVPGSYTSFDGKRLAQYYRLLDSLGKSKKYEYVSTLGQFRLLFLSVIDRLYMAEYRPAGITCSGGDCNFGYDINGHMHICHRMFFLNNDEYIKGLIKESERDNWDLDLVRKNTAIDFIKKYYTPHVDNNHDILRMLYLNRGFHDFIKTRQEFIYCALKELAFAGQTSSVYVYDDDLCMFFSLIMALTYTCSAEALIVNGHMNSIPLSLIRAFANGVFEDTVEWYVKRRENMMKVYKREGK